MCNRVRQVSDIILYAKDRHKVKYRPNIKKYPLKGYVQKGINQ